VDDGTKIRVEVELDKDLVELAAGAGLDVNKLAGQALQRALGGRQLATIPRYAARRERLRKKIQGEIAWYNAHVEKNGLFADEWRRF
jgi:post-segregation antitoxin (ccd killing protein)